jgi:hypothetical protein
MAYLFEDYSSYSKNILNSEGVELKSGISFDSSSDGIGFNFKKDSNTIAFGQNSLTCALLYVCYLKNPKIIRVILIYYHLAFNKISNLHFGSAIFLLDKLCNYLDKNYQYLYNLASTIDIQSLVHFMIGHETVHACCNNNSEYKKNKIHPIKQEIDLLCNDDGIISPRTKYVYKLVPKISTNNDIEEFVCDSISLQYLIESLKNKINHDNIKQYVFDISTLVYMQIFTKNIDTISKYSNKISIFITNNNRTYAASCLRLSYSLEKFKDSFSEIEEFNLDYAKIYKIQEKNMRKLMNGIWSMGVSNFRHILGFFGNTDNSQTDNLNDKQGMMDVFSNISIKIQELLIGEEKIF